MPLALNIEYWQKQPSKCQVEVLDSSLAHERYCGNGHGIRPAEQSIPWSDQLMRQETLPRVA